MGFRVMWHFERPEYLYILLLLPIFVFIFIQRQKIGRGILLRYMHKACLSVVVGAGFEVKRVSRYICLLLMFLFLVIALAGPQGSPVKKKTVVEGAEVMILADVSKSMLVADMGGVSRLSVMKKELARLVHKLSGQRVGLIAFAGSSILLSPLTLDHSALLLHIETLSPRSLYAQGTDFGSALHKAWHALRRGGVSEGSQATRVIVVASDGEDNERQGKMVAKKLVMEGVRVFSIGFGTKKGAPIPMYDKMGNKIGYKKNSKGHLVISHFNELVLKKIAQITRGAFYHLSVGDHSVSKIHSDIQAFGEGKVNYGSHTVYQKWHTPFVILSLLFGALYFLIGERVKLSKTWQSLFTNIVKK